MTNPNHRQNYFMTSIVFKDVVVRNYLSCGPDKKTSNIVAPFMFDESMSAQTAPPCLKEAGFKHERIEPIADEGIQEIAKERFDWFVSDKRDYYVVHDSATPTLRTSLITSPNPKTHPEMKLGDLWIGLCYKDGGKTRYFERCYRGRV
jgi:hypothetical protein